MDSWQQVRFVERKKSKEVKTKQKVIWKDKHRLCWIIRSRHPSHLYDSSTPSTPPSLPPDPRCRKPPKWSDDGGPICYKCLLGHRRGLQQKPVVLNLGYIVKSFGEIFKTPDARLFPRPITSKFLWVGPRHSIFIPTLGDSSVWL